MYYILNETHQIIAADDKLLTYCDVAHINELSKQIAKGNIEFDLASNETVALTRSSKEEVFSVKKIVLSSLLGNLTLVSILSNKEKEDTDLSSILEDEPSELIESIVNDTNNTHEQEEEKLTLDTTALGEFSSGDINMDSIDKSNEDERITFGDHLALDDAQDDDIISFKEVVNKSDVQENTTVSNEKELHSVDLQNDDEFFDLLLEDSTAKLNEEKNEDTSLLDLDDVVIDFNLSSEDDAISNLNEQEEVTEIIIDSESISKKIGISNDDYKNFLNDFIDTALSLEKDLQDSDVDTRDNAISALSHLSDVLHLSIISDIISNIKNNGTQREDIETLYGTLSRITTLESKEEVEKLELFDEPPSEPIIQENVSPKNSSQGDTFGTISFDGIKPKHFDFQLEEAANDLSLPIELIEEFVNDFIDQAHIETKKMLQAYEDGDLDTIQKIGHLLKGASSNLRINALSDTLYKIQFCEKSTDLESLIKDYWAHFLSLETQINIISH